MYAGVFNLQLEKELDAFDLAFLEEIKDLKYNYQEAVEKNIQCEEKLTALAKQFIEFLFLVWRFHEY